MLSSPGIGSGLDISSIIGQLMSIESRPLFQLGVEQVELQAQLSGFGKLKSDLALFKGAMTDLGDADKFKFFKATSSSADVLGASADATAAKGTYAIEVQRIAENHRQAAATVFADSDTAIIGLPGDSMTITVGGTAFVVDIGDKTLSDARDAINAASDNSGVTASILQDDAGYHLTLSADSTGSSNFVATSYSGVDPFALQDLNLDRDASTTFTSADLDAVVVLENTFTVTRSSNAVSDAIEGVTLNLVTAGTLTLDVTRDDDKIRASVQQFTAGYNAVVNTLSELRGNVLADERTSLLSLGSQFRDILNSKSGTSEKFSFLFELGVSTQLDGTLSLDSTIFNSALDSDPDGIADMFSNATSGLATRFESLADRLLSASGLLTNREESINSRIRDVESSRGNLEFRLIRKEQALVQQFAALDALLANLSATSSFLGTQLTQISNITSSSNGGNRR
jgi:flagellar hook-associated protein 2